MIDPTIPLIDLHRHLDGNVRLGTLLDLSQKYGIQFPAEDVESLRPYVQVTQPQPGVMAFLERFQWLTAVMVDYDACRRIAYENVEDAKIEELDYIELRFSPWFMAQTHQLDPAGVVEAVVDGVEKGRQDFQQPVNLIGIISRTYGPEAAWNELNALLTQREKIVGLDLAGDEAQFPGEWFVDHFKRARDAGWKITVHAGESAGPHSIWQAIKGLGAIRIGHAVRAPEDQELMGYLLDQRIGIETNLTSNVQTSTVSSYAEHPIKLFLEKGILATLCSDDPGISNINLKYEYNVAAEKAGLSGGQITQLQRNALEIAFISPEEKKNLAKL